MKTLKKNFTRLEAKIKKYFFNKGILGFNSKCSYVKSENNKLPSDKEIIRFEDYISKYRTTTRWQTI